MKRYLIAGLVSVFLICGCISSDDNDDEEEKEKIRDVVIEDAYCYNDTFYFTIVNTREESINVQYNWTLNDPLADLPAYLGNGTADIDNSSMEEINITICEDNYVAPGPYFAAADYDSRYYIMIIDIYENDAKIFHYREQKSEYDWDYSTLPPEKKEGFLDE